MASLQHLYKAIKCDSDLGIFSSLTRHADLHSHETRCSDNLLVPFYRLSNSQRSISYLCPTYWNSLPLQIKNSSSFPMFKREIKKLILLEY